MNKSYAKSSVLTLKKRLSDVERELAAAEPDLVAESSLLRNLITAREQGLKAAFADVRTIVMAILRCFELKGDWMTREEIRDMLVESGYIVKVETALALITDTLRHHVETSKRIARKGNLFGKPQWLVAKISDSGK